MNLFAKCSCGINFYHCDGKCNNQALPTVSDLFWWRPEEVVPRLKELRKVTNRTLRDVENATGISNAYLSQLENGKIKKPAYETVYRLKSYYETTLQTQTTTDQQQ